MKKLFVNLGLVMLIFTMLSACEAENEMPDCAITQPLLGEEIEHGDIVNVVVDANDGDGSIKEVRFYIDDIGVASSSSFPYSFLWNTADVELGNHTIKVVAIDDLNAESKATMDINIESGKYIIYKGTKYELSEGNYQNFIFSDQSKDGFQILTLWSGVSLVNEYEINGTGNVLELLGDLSEIRDALMGITTVDKQVVVETCAFYLNTTFMGTDHTGGDEGVVSTLVVNLKSTDGAVVISAEGITDVSSDLVKFSYNGPIEILDDVIW